MAHHRLEQLAHKIAYNTARSDIECHAHGINIGRGRRPIYDLAEINDEYREELADAVEYLARRGLLIHPDPAKLSHVSIADDPLDTVAASSTLPHNPRAAWPFGPSEAGPSTRATA